MICKVKNKNTAVDVFKMGNFWWYTYCSINRMVLKVGNSIESYFQTIQSFQTYVEESGRCWDE